MPDKVKKTRRTPEQIIADLEEKQQLADKIAKKKKAQLQAQIKNQKAKLTTAQRAEDTHCKVVAGALAIANCAYDPDFSAKLKKLIEESNEQPETKEKILARL